MAVSWCGDGRQAFACQQSCLCLLFVFYYITSLSWTLLLLAHCSKVNSTTIKGLARMSQHCMGAFTYLLNGNDLTLWWILWLPNDSHYCWLAALCCNAAMLWGCMWCIPSCMHGDVVSVQAYEQTQFFYQHLAYTLVSKRLDGILNPRAAPLLAAMLGPCASHEWYWQIL